MAIIPVIAVVLHLTLGLVCGLDGPPVKNQLPIIACLEDVACFGSRDGRTSYGIGGETLSNSCIKKNNCIIRVRTGLYDGKSKVWWELQIPAAWNTTTSNDAVEAMFWVSKTRSNMDRPNGRVAVKVRLFTSPTKVKETVVQDTDSVLVTPNNRKVSNGNIKGFRYKGLTPNQYWTDDPIADGGSINYVNILHFDSGTKLEYQDNEGHKCYEVNLLTDAVFLHLRVRARLLAATEMAVSDSPMKLFQYKTANNNPSLKGLHPVTDSIACTVESADDIHGSTKRPTSSRPTPRPTKAATVPVHSSTVTPLTNPKPDTSSPAVVTTSLIKDSEPTTAHSESSSGVTRSLPTLPTGKDSKQSSSPTVFYILGGILIIIILLIALAWFICRKWPKRRKNPGSKRVAGDKELRSTFSSTVTKPASGVHTRSAMTSTDYAKAPKSSSLETIPRSRMKSAS